MSAQALAVCQNDEHGPPAFELRPLSDLGRRFVLLLRTPHVTHGTRGTHGTPIWAFLSLFKPKKIVTPPPPTAPVLISNSGLAASNGVSSYPIAKSRPMQASPSKRNDKNAAHRFGANGERLSGLSVSARNVATERAEPIAPLSNYGLATPLGFLPTGFAFSASTLLFFAWGPSVRAPPDC